MAGRVGVPSIARRPAPLAPTESDGRGRRDGSAQVRGREEGSVTDLPLFTQLREVVRLAKVVQTQGQQRRNMRRVH